VAFSKYVSDVVRAETCCEQREKSNINKFSVAIAGVYIKQQDAPHKDNIQIATGLFLAIHYCSNIEIAFSRVVHICPDVNCG
jgi:hypothetical protein